MAKKIKLGTADTVKALVAQMDSDELADTLNFIRFTQRMKFPVKRLPAKKQVITKASEAARTFSESAQEVAALVGAYKSV